MKFRHVIIQSHPIFDIFRADFAFIARGTSVFGLDVIFNDCSTRLVSTRQAFPLAPTEICHHFLRIHCNEEYQTVREDRMYVFSTVNESIQLRLLVSSRKMIFEGNLILEYLRAFGAVIASGHGVFRLNMAPDVTRHPGLVAAL